MVLLCLVSAAPVPVDLARGFAVVDSDAAMEKVDMFTSGVTCTSHLQEDNVTSGLLNNDSESDASNAEMLTESSGRNTDPSSQLQLTDNFDSVVYNADGTKPDTDQTTAVEHIVDDATDCKDGHFSVLSGQNSHMEDKSVSYTHLTLPTKRIV